jgi:two-component system response regulator PilR (NtrC family)
MATFLVIDDEPALLDLITNILRRDDYIVRAVSDPLEGMRICQAGARFDLIITDVCMKPIDGIELMERLRDAGIDCPALFMSGYSHLAATISETMGHRLIIEKPFTGAQFRRAVNNILRKYGRMQDAA